jgi:hypothetical protein
MIGSIFNLWIMNNFLLNENNAMNMGTLQKIVLRTQSWSKGLKKKMINGNKLGRRSPTTRKQTMQHSLSKYPHRA